MHTHTRSKIGERSAGRRTVTTLEAPTSLEATVDTGKARRSRGHAHVLSTETTKMHINT